MDLSSHSAAFVASVRRLRCSFPAVLASLAVASQLAKHGFGVHLNMCSHDENEGNAVHSCSPPLRWGGSGCAQMERHIRNRIQRARRDLQSRHLDYKDLQSEISALQMLILNPAGLQIQQNHAE